VEVLLESGVLSSVEESGSGASEKERGYAPDRLYYYAAVYTYRIAINILKIYNQALTGITRIG